VSRREIEEIVARETQAWNTQDVDLLMTVLHPDMVWPWPSDHRSLDPMTWTLELGRYDHARWRAGWQELFATHELIHNRRAIARIELSREGDGAFAVVDIDTLWRANDGSESHWQGRTCKIYSRVGGEWKMITQLGTFDPVGACD
jgi:ketosteroid isomerase-like protein